MIEVGDGDVLQGCKGFGKGGCRSWIEEVGMEGV